MPPSKAEAVSAAPRPSGDASYPLLPLPPYQSPLGGRIRASPEQAEDYLLACYRYIELKTVGAGRNGGGT